MRGYSSEVETEEQGNRMADAIEGFAKAMYEKKFILTGDVVEYHKLASEMDAAADNWRTHGGREI